MAYPELYFNIDSGYLEGICRGFRGGILTRAEYLNLVQCESLEDLKVQLQATDYGSFLQNEASPLTVSVIGERQREKLGQSSTTCGATATRLSALFSTTSREPSAESVISSGLILTIDKVQNAVD